MTTNKAQQPSSESAHIDSPALPARVVIGAIDHPDMEIVSWQVDAPHHGSPVALDAEQRSAMSALLSQVPALMQSTHGALAQTYRLSFSPEVVQRMTGVMKATGGGLRAQAVDASNKIVGQGVLSPANGVKALSAATAVWQGLAIVTAQVHLAEINARLAKIEQGIDTIKAMLEAEQASKLVTGLHYVREASAALARGDIDDHERRLMAAQIETIWRECGQVAHTCLQMLNRAPQELKELPLSAFYYLDESAKLADKILTDYERRAAAYLLALYVRSATVALREPLHLSRGVSEERYKEVGRHLAEWRASNQDFFQLAQQRISNDLSATVSKQATVDKKRNVLRAYARDVKAQLSNQCTALEQIIRDLQQQLQQSLDMIVTLDEHGQIAEAFHVPAVQIPL